MASIEPYKNKNQVYPMSLFRKSAFTAILLLSASGVANAATSADDLLNQIDADIAAKRLGAPAGNNAIEKIWQFKDSSPYDQRINTRAFHVGEFYVGLANKAIAAKKYAEAQDNLDKAWDIASLTPGLSKAQDNLDAATGKPSIATIQARPATPAPAAAPVKEDNSAELAAAAKKAENDAKVLAAKRADDEARAQALAAKKAADDEKAKALAAKKAEESKSVAAKKEDEKAKALAAKKAAEEEKANKLAEAKALKEELAAKKAEQAKLQADARKEQENKRLAAEKVIVVAAASAAGNDDEEDMPADAPKETEASIAKFDLTTSSVSNRSTAEIRGQLEPICQEIIDNDASVVLHTPNLQDARWLVVRLTLCVRRIDKDFRLRHSYDITGDAQPSVSLHAGRNVSLVKKARQ
jgi:colicin import membrane protein